MGPIAVKSGPSGPLFAPKAITRTTRLSTFISCQPTKNGPFSIHEERFVIGNAFTLHILTEKIRESSKRSTGYGRKGNGGVSDVQSFTAPFRSFRFPLEYVTLLSVCVNRQTSVPRQAPDDGSSPHKKKRITIIDSSFR